MNNLDLIATGMILAETTTATVPPGLSAGRENFLNELKKVLDTMANPEGEGKNLPEQTMKSIPTEDNSKTENNSHMAEYPPTVLVSYAEFAELMAAQASAGGEKMRENDKNYADTTPLIDAIQAELDNGIINKVSRDDLPTAEQYLAYFEEMLVAAKEILSMMKQDNSKVEESTDMETESMGVKHMNIMPEIRSAAAQLTHAENLSQPLPEDAAEELPAQTSKGPVAALSQQKQQETPLTATADTKETALLPEATEIKAEKAEPVRPEVKVEKAETVKPEMPVREESAADKKLFAASDRQQIKTEGVQTNQAEAKTTEAPITKPAPEQAQKTDSKSADVKQAAPLPKEAEVIMNHASPQTAAAKTETKGETPRNVQINNNQEQAQTQQTKVATTKGASSGNNENSGKNAESGDKSAAKTAPDSTASQTTARENTSAKSFESELTRSVQDADGGEVRQAAETLTQRTANNTAPQQEARHIDRTLEWESAKNAVKLARLVQQAGQEGATKLTVRLAPEHLGKLEIQLTEVAGRINAKFVAGSAESRNVLVSHGDAITRALAEKGITIDNMDFNFHDSLAKQGSTGADGQDAKQPHQRGQENTPFSGDGGNENEEQEKAPKGLYA